MTDNVDEKFEKALAAQNGGEFTPAKRRKRGSVGGFKKKLDAPERKGYVRRWVNDDGNRLAEMGELAYDFVSDTSIKSSDAGSRISRLVGTKANGEPLRAYLMETPEKEYQAGVDEKEAQLKEIDEAMHRLVNEQGQTATPSAEQYGQVSINRGR